MNLDRAPVVGHGDALTYQVIGLAMEVHRDLGPGLDEVFYHRRLASRLNSAGTPCLCKPRRELVYKGQLADVFEPDLVLPNQLVIELKAQRGGLTGECLTQLLSYLKFWGISTGLLFDFAKERLIFQRVIYTEATLHEFLEQEAPAFVSDRGLASTILSNIKMVYEEHGLGYADTTYRGLLLAAFKAAGIPCQTEPEALLPDLGPASLRCLVLNKRCVLTLSALGDGLTAAERAVTQTYLRLLNLAWGMTVHFGKRSIALRFVNHPGGEKRSEALHEFGTIPDEERLQEVPPPYEIVVEEYSI